MLNVEVERHKTMENKDNDRNERPQVAVAGMMLSTKGRNKGA
jgi:hypothetical protein